MGLDKPPCKKLSGVKSGERGAHIRGATLPIYRSGKVYFRKARTHRRNGVEHHIAERQKSVKQHPA